jgi:hypothetical protein
MAVAESKGGRGVESVEGCLLFLRDVSPNFLESGILKDTFNFGIADKEVSNKFGLERGQSI